MDKFIMFAGRQIPIAIPYPVFSYVNNTGPSFYKPGETLTEDRVMQMSLLRPDLRNYSWRARLTRTPEQLFNVPQDEVALLGEAIWQIALHHDVTTDAATTFNVLCTRGLSTHFVVNYDGALYQFMDCYHVAWATGETFEDADLGFSVQPFVKSAETTGNTAMICFGCSHANQVSRYIAVFKGPVRRVRQPDEQAAFQPVVSGNRKRISRTGSDDGRDFLLIGKPALSHLG